MVHKDTDITIVVKENRIETPGYRSIIFERPQNFLFESGDWIDINFSKQNLKGGRTFSLSSSPTEPDLMITFKDGISEIKRALSQLKPGDKLKIAGYGNDYRFTLNRHKCSTFIAGGVGIAPFRSMLQEMIDLKVDNKVHLVYLNQNSDFLFQSELELWSNMLTGFNCTYIVTKELKKKDKDRALLAAIHSFDQSFYIAGPETMVDNTEHLLLDFGVVIDDIKIDSFSGY